MKTAVMSDVHANPAALRAALVDSRLLGCTRWIFLGDVTGYGYDVRVALELVRARFDVALMGNHDSVLLGREPAMLVLLCPNYDIDVRQRHQLNDEEKDWLRQRPFVHREAGATFVHGDMTSPAQWRYILDTPSAILNFKATEDDAEKVIFCGHSHHAEVWEREPSGAVRHRYDNSMDKPAEVAESVVIDLAPDRRYIVNVGSVGYPRNDLCMSYAVYDPEECRVTLRRLPFDFPGYIANLQSAGVTLPRWLR